MGESWNDDDLSTELLYNNIKDKLLAWDINIKAIVSNLRITKIARFNLYGQSYTVLSF